MSQVPAPGPLADDATDTRGAHFNALMRSPVNVVGGAILILAAAIALGAAGGPGLGAAAAGGALVLVLVGAWRLASRQARGDFFRAYADGRRLAWTDDRTTLPAITPLLLKGDRRYAEQTFVGTLPGGLDGKLALYTYEDKRGGDVTYHRHTVVIASVPEAAPLVRELLCHGREGPRLLDSAEDLLSRRRRIELESDAADSRYEIFAGSDDDANRVRQLFAPSFIVWLAEAAPASFAFELVAGVLVASVEGHGQTAGRLDAVCRAAARVAERLREEAAE